MTEEDQIGAEDITFNKLNKADDLLIQEDTLKGYTIRIIQHFLDKYNYNVITVADKLGVGKSTIYQTASTRKNHKSEPPQARCLRDLFRLNMSECLLN